MPKGAGYTREETERFIRFWNDHWENYGLGTWAVTDRQSGELYGHCGLNTVKDLSEVEVLYALGRNGRGKGFGTEAAKASIEYAFNDVGLKRLIALAKPANLPSIGVMKKNGNNYEKDVHLWNIDFALYSQDNPLK